MLMSQARRRAAACAGTPGNDPRLSSGVQRDLFSRRGERPRDLHPALLPEHKAHLARRPQAFRMVRTEGCAGAGFADRAEHVLMKEAVLATHLRH